MSFLRSALYIVAYLMLAAPADPAWCQETQKKEVRIPYSATEWTTVWMPQEFAEALSPYEFGGFMLTLRLDTLTPVVNPVTRRSYSWGQWQPRVVTVWIYAFDPKAAGTPAAQIVEGLRRVQVEHFRHGALVCFRHPREPENSSAHHQCGMQPDSMAYAAFGSCQPNDPKWGNPRCDLRAAFDGRLRARFNFSILDGAEVGGKYERLVDLLRSFLVK